MRRTWGVAVSIAALAGIAGCGNSSGEATASRADSPSTSSARTTVPVSKLAVSAQQLGSGWISQPMAGGDQVQGQVTMDLCGAEFPSESLRTARYQVILSSSDSGERFSNEVVLYRPGGAQQARAELLKAIATCPSGPVKGAVRGEGMLTFKVDVLPSDSHWLPGTVAVHGVATDSSGQSEDQVLIYQFRGDAMSAIYGAATNGEPDSTELQASADAAALLEASVPAAA